MRSIGFPLSVLVAAVAQPVVCASIAFAGHPWLALMWALLVTGSIAGVVQSRLRLSPAMSDVIRRVDRERDRLGPTQEG